MQTLSITEIEQVDGGVAPLVFGAAKVIGYVGGTMGIVSFLMEVF